MSQVIKIDLIKEPIDKNVIILAESIYSTYLTNKKEVSMLVNVNKFCTLFNLENSAISLKMIFDIFIDLTEPIMIKNFEFRGKQYTNIILTFCTFNFFKKKDIEMVKIEINEMYLEALKTYTLNPYIKIQ